jgi:class 3 adenylate cyclase
MRGSVIKAPPRKTVSPNPSLEQLTPHQERRLVQGKDNIPPSPLSSIKNSKETTTLIPQEEKMSNSKGRKISSRKKENLKSLRLKEKLLHSFIPQQIMNEVMHNMSFESDQSNNSLSQSIQSNNSGCGSEISRALYSKEAHNVSVIFCDIVGFSKISDTISPSDVMCMLQDLFHRFDKICKCNSILKLDTIGDAYVCSSGLLERSERSEQDNHTTNTSSTSISSTSTIESIDNNTSSAKRALATAKAMIKEARKVPVPKMSSEEPTEYLSIRVGIHVGDVTYGVLGQNSPKLVCIGRSMTIAQEMETTSSPNMIHVSKDFHDLIEGDDNWERCISVDTLNTDKAETWILDPLIKR